MYRPETIEYPNKKAAQEKDILTWITDLMQEKASDKSAKNIIVEDNTYWEEGRVSPEIMDLIGKTEAVQEAFKELREKRGEMGEKDVRHMIRVAELVRVAIDAGQIVLAADDRRDLLVAALCHDEGKADPEVREILMKKKGEDLSPEERKIMQKHVRAGYEFLKNHGEERSGRIVLCHHEISDEEMSRWIALYNHGNTKEGSYPRGGKERRKTKAEVEVDRRIGERRDKDDGMIRRLGNFLSIVDKIEANGSQDRPYNRGRKARELKAAREESLRKFSSPEERLIISILEEIDPNNLTQRAQKEDLEMEKIRQENIREMEGYTSS